MYYSLLFYSEFILLFIKRKDITSIEKMILLIIAKLKITMCQISLDNILHFIDVSRKNKFLILSKVVTFVK